MWTYSYGPYRESLPIKLCSCKGSNVRQSFKEVSTLVEALSRKLAMNFLHFWFLLNILKSLCFLLLCSSNPSSSVFVLFCFFFLNKEEYFNRFSENTEMLPSYLSSWIQPTEPLCYNGSIEEAKTPFLNSNFKTLLSVLDFLTIKFLTRLPGGNNFSLIH